MTQDYFIWYLDEKFNRTTEQIIETDTDALRYSINKTCVNLGLKPAFIYFYDTNKEFSFKNSNLFFWPKKLNYFFKLIGLLKKTKILYLNVHGIKELLVAILGKWTNEDLKIIYHFHGLFKIEKIGFLKRLFYKVFLSQMNVIVTDTRIESKKVNIFLNKNIAHVFVYGSDLKPIEFKEHEKITLVFVGRISRDKEIEKVIDGVERWKNKVKLIIIGNFHDMEYYTYLKQKISFESHLLLKIP